MGRPAQTPSLKGKSHLLYIWWYNKCLGLALKVREATREISNRLLANRVTNNLVWEKEQTEGIRQLHVSTSISTNQKLKDFTFYVKH